MPCIQDGIERLAPCSITVGFGALFVEAVVQQYSYVVVSTEAVRGWQRREPRPGKR